MPLTIRQRLLDLLAIGRVANLPTVWSNLVLGILLGLAVPSHILTVGPVGPSGTSYWSWNPDVSLPQILSALLGVTCAYLCGTFLNDWKDAEFDRSHRPERAIPAGRFLGGTILLAAIGFGAVSLAAFFLLSVAALAAGLVLIACILTYTWIHKRTPLAIIPMGLCRACLYVIGFLTVASDQLWQVVLEDLLRPARLLGDPVPGTVFLQTFLMALGILVYIAGLTLAARYESRPEGLKAPRVLLWFLIFIPLLTHTWWWIFHRPPFLEGWHLAIPALIGLLPFLLWTTRALVVLKKSIPDFVSRTLAGLCLVDLLALPGIAASIQTPWPFVNAYSLLLAIIPLSLFLLALVLQRLAPAT